jgi:hypothetical protein
LSEFWAAALGTFFGLIAGVALEWWKSGREDINDLCKGFCELIGAAADVGAEFWLIPGNHESVSLLLVRLGGFQSRLAGYATILEGRLDSEMLEEIETKLALLFMELTGGDPDDPMRLRSKDRASSVYDAASAAIVAVRQGAFYRMSFRQRVFRYCSRSWVNRPITMKFPPENIFPGRK